ncbi:MAG: hypothetical protein NTX15_00275 [Candidatus Kapabacteria bacterium]|nr:hypothetical protein [Candidatus Kapabacteria bacterium]
MRYTILVVLSLIALSADALAQDTASVKQKKAKESSEMFMMDMDFEDRKPMVSLFYGSGSPTRDGLTGTVENTMTIGGTLGMENEKTWWRDPSIVRRYANTLYLWYGKGADAQGITTAMNGDNPAVATTTSMNLFRIGVADESGFGYKFSET